MHCPSLPQTAREMYCIRFGRVTQFLNVTWSSHHTGSPDRQQTMHGFGSAQLLAIGKSAPELSHSTGDKSSRHVPSGKQHGTIAAGPAQAARAASRIVTTTVMRVIAIMEAGGVSRSR